MSENLVKTESSINENTWNDLKWGKLQSHVRRVQYQIYKTQKSGNTNRVHSLQRMLINSKAAKLVATHRVTTLNKGKRTAGIDKKVLLKPEEKYQLAITLSLDGQASPIRRVWLPKPGKIEKRPLGIPIICDRAKQELARMALEPQWEAVFEPNSYGFRPGRGCHDAIEAIYLCLRGGNTKWVFDADIRKCFDMIDHDALLEKLDTFPLMKQQIKAWLKAGVMEGYANEPKPREILETTAGTPQGGVISPLLANIALHGLENHLKEFVTNISTKPHPGANRGKVAKSKALGVIRYADDFVLIHRNREILELCMAETQKWLAKVGLAISEEKSALRDSRNGFLFLGFQIIHVKKPTVGVYKIKIQPSKKKQADLLNKVKKIVTSNKSVSSYDLIALLRPVIIGWANYYRYCECKAVFQRLTHKIFQKIRAWVFRRDTRNGRLKVKQKYFPSGKEYKFDGRIYRDNWILNGTKVSKKGERKVNFLPHIVWVKSIKHVKIKGDESPYSNSIYWALRSNKNSPYNTRVTKLLQNQKQICPWCKEKFTTFDSVNWEVDHTLPKSKGGKDIYTNLQLLHKHCHMEKTKADFKKE
jgi:RNA-directed DNA polymerase